jgi:hypothetical protein
MMFVLTGEAGEYEDHNSWVEACSSDKAKLEERVVQLKEQNQRKSDARKEYSVRLKEEMDKVKPLIESADAALPEEPVLEECECPPRTKEEHAARTKVKAKHREAAKEWWDMYTKAHHAITDPVEARVKAEIANKYNVPSNALEGSYWVYYKIEYHIEEVEEI